MRPYFDTREEATEFAHERIAKNGCGYIMDTVGRVVYYSLYEDED